MERRLARVGAELGHSAVESPGISAGAGDPGTCRPMAALLDPEPVEQALVAAPALAHPDLEVEVDAAAELALELRAGGGADLLDLAAARADQDPLLGLGLGPDLGADLDQAVLALRRPRRPATSTACGISSRVRRRTCSRISSASSTSLGLVAALLGRVEERALGDQLDRAASISGSSPSPLRALTGKISSTPSSSAAAASTAAVSALFEPVDLVDGADHRASRRSRSSSALAMKRSPGPDALLAVDDEERPRRSRRARARPGAACAR